MMGGAAGDIADLIGETEALAVDPALAGSTLDRLLSPTGVGHGRVQQAVRQLHCFCLPLLRPHCHSRLGRIRLLPPVHRPRSSAFKQAPKVIPLITGVFAPRENRYGVY